MNHNAWLSLGSNLGNRRNQLQFAFNRLDENPLISIEKVSSIYISEPWGLIKQNAFYNTVLEIRTSLTPLQLLNYIQSIENEAGRKRTIKWGPRVLDIDIILFNQFNIHLEKLVIPHPQITRRKFVLIPLAEISPELFVPGVGALKDIISFCNQNQKIVKLFTSQQWGEECCDENNP